MRMPSWIRQHLAAVRALLVLTVVTGIVYPLAVWAVAQVPGLHDKAEGSTIKGPNGQTVGSSLIGQAYLDKDGNPLTQYIQSRPSSAGDGYDPTATAASNLGPEDVLDTLPDPALIQAGKEDENAKQSLLTQVCARSLAIGKLDGVDGSRPFCTPDGVGAVLKVFGPRATDGTIPRPVRVVSANQQCPTTPFLTTYKGIRVECAKFGEDLAAGLTVPIKGNAPTDPKVPADAVTGSGSGLDPEISPAYARLQAARVAKARGISVDQVLAVIRDQQNGRGLGFLGEARVNVLRVNIQLDEKYPFRG